MYVHCTYAHHTCERGERIYSAVFLWRLKGRAEGRHESTDFRQCARASIYTASFFDWKFEIRIIRVQ